MASGATEIDIVISRAFVLEANWEALYTEVKAMRKACGEAHLKTIIATGTCTCAVAYWFACLTFNLKVAGVTWT